MRTTKCQKFKGEIENYLRNGRNNFDVKIDRTFCSLKFKTWLCKSNIVKRDGYPSAHILLILFVLPLLRLKTVNSFCNKKWHQWSVAGKDTFYRFKTRAYRWRSLLYKIMQEISHQLQFDRTVTEGNYFIIDDTTIPKRGKLMENVSYIYDHSIGRSVLGFCIVSLGFFTASGYYPLDFSYWVSKVSNLTVQRGWQLRWFLEILVQDVRRTLDHKVLLIKAAATIDRPIELIPIDNDAQRLFVADTNLWEVSKM